MTQDAVALDRTKLSSLSAVQDLADAIERELELLVTGCAPA